MFDKLPPGAGDSFVQSLVAVDILDPHAALADYEGVRERLDKRAANKE